MLLFVLGVSKAIFRVTLARHAIKFHVLVAGGVRRGRLQLSARLINLALFHW